MRLVELKIEGFRCFKDQIVLNLEQFTCLIGTNGVGKTAVLQALCKLFGDTQEQRLIRKTDFYIEPNSDFKAISKKDLFISATFDYPEIDNGNGLEKTIPLAFRSLSYKREDGKLYSSIELHATWEDNDTTEGSIETEYYWKLQDKKQKLKAQDKSLIRLFYIPAIRNPEKEIKIISGSALKKILDYIEWNKEFEEEIQEKLESLQQNISTVKGICSLESELSAFWTQFSSNELYSALRILPSDSDMDEVVKKLVIKLKTMGDSYITVDQLSDGNKSLFYLSLLSTLFSVQNKLNTEQTLDGLQKDKKDDCCLTIFALEEPENHLSPHYLGKIIKVFRTLSSRDGQTIISSHSPSLLKRISPENVRYFRWNEGKVQVKKILLPSDDINAFKYVKEAVQSHPELYFSKLVIFGEGDSEEYLIPKICEMNNISLDENFISFIPLSGRFTNHFWKLVKDLCIPCITLLDFDLGRNTGGIDKIKYVKDQLIKIQDLSENEIEFVEDTQKSITEKIDLFKKKNVFFSYPIDIDYLMLTNYYEEYTENSILPKPRLPLSDNPKKDEKNLEAICSVLKKHNDNYSLEDVPAELEIDQNIESFYWYRTLFLGEGKPVTHKLVWNSVEESIKEGRKRLTVFEDLMTRIKEIING